MQTTIWSLESFLEYVEDFRFHMMLAGNEFQPPDSEVVKIFVKGLQPATLQTEICKKSLDTLHEVIEETTDVIVRYKAIFDIQESVHKPSTKKSTKKSSSKVTEDTTEVTDAPPVAAPPKKSNSDNAIKKSTQVTCYKCLQPGHLAPNCPNKKHPKSTWQPRSVRSVKKSEEAETSTDPPVARSIRVFSTDMNVKPDTFIRLNSSILAVEDELVISPVQVQTSVFLDTGANINSVTSNFVNQVIKPVLPSIQVVYGKPFSVELAGGQTIRLSGDSVHLILQIDSSTGKLRFKEQFFIFESCGEDISIGVASIRSWLGHPEMANIIFGSKKEDVVSEEETEFSSDVQLFPDPIVHSMNSVHVNSTFPELNKLNKIIEKHSTILFGAFDAQGLKVEPMDIQLKENCSIKMQPARFINKEIMSKVKDELDRLESWGVLQKIDDAAIGSPLVIVQDLSSYSGGIEDPTN